MHLSCTMPETLANLCFTSSSPCAVAGVQASSTRAAEASSFSFISSSLWAMPGRHHGFCQGSRGFFSQVRLKVNNNFYY